MTPDMPQDVGGMGFAAVLPPGVFANTAGGAAIGNPMMMRSAQERQFQQGIRATPWFSEYVKQYGEEPDLNTKDYDYRKAWGAGIRPERDPYDNNRYHWRSSTDDGSMLKSADHPTAWKEHYMRATGKNPDAVGATEQDWKRMIRK